MTALTFWINGDGQAIVPVAPDAKTIGDENLRMARVGEALVAKLAEHGIDATVLHVGSDAIGPEWDERQIIPTLSVGSHKAGQAASVLRAAYTDIVEHNIEQEV